VLIFDDKEGVGDLDIGGGGITSVLSDSGGGGIFSLLTFRFLQFSACLAISSTLG